MITIENDIVAGDLPLWFRGNFYDRFLQAYRSGRFVFLSFRKARQRTVNWAGSKIKCVELCNFRFCCAFIFCQPMKKFVFFGASRATCQRHFKTSSTGDENGFAPETAQEKASDTLSTSKYGVICPPNSKFCLQHCCFKIISHFTLQYSAFVNMQHSYSMFNAHMCFINTVQLAIGLQRNLPGISSRTKSNKNPIELNQIIGVRVIGFGD